MKQFSRYCSIPLAVAAVLLVGCGPDVELATVQGQVLYNGKKLPFGSVTFQPPSGQPSTARIQADGTFRLNTRGQGEGAVVGRNQVRVTCFQGQDPSKSRGADGNDSLGSSLIPERYNSYETSGIVIDVPAGNRDPIVLELVD